MITDQYKDVIPSSRATTPLHLGQLWCGPVKGHGRKVKPTWVDVTTTTPPRKWKTPNPSSMKRSIHFKGKVKPVIAATLKKIHQQLGHPPHQEMIQHLRVGGASPAIIQAARQMVCRTCEKSTKAKTPRVTQPCVALDFNQVVAADIIWVDSMTTSNFPLLNVVDLASTYQVVIPLPGTKSEEVALAFIQGWTNWAGTPKHLLVDLDSAFKDRFLEMADNRSIRVRCSAGQAHWQNGVCERHGKTWKGIWDKLVEEEIITDDELEEAVAATSNAKNQLRNRSGYSPRQWVFGAPDEKMSRSHVIRMGARAAYFQYHAKQSVDEALHHRPRVEGIL